MKLTVELSKCRKSRLLVAECGELMTASELIQHVKDGDQWQWHNWKTAIGGLEIVIDVEEDKI